MTRGLVVEADWTASRAPPIERIHRSMRASEAALAAGISHRTAYKWIARHAREGRVGLRSLEFNLFQPVYG